MSETDGLVRPLAEVRVSDLLEIIGRLYVENSILRSEIGRLKAELSVLASVPSDQEQNR